MTTKLPEIAKTEAILTSILNEVKVHEEALAPNVAVTTGHGNKDGVIYTGNNADHDNLTFTITSDAALKYPRESVEAVMKRLNDIHVLGENIKLESDEDHAVKLKAKLQEFFDAGAPLDKNLLNWHGFDAKDVKKGDIQPHALDNVLGSSEGVSFTFAQIDKDVDKVEANIKARANEIKANIKASILDEKKTPELKGNREDLAKLVDGLEIEMHKNAMDWGTNLYVKLRSPLQIKADEDKTLKEKPPEDAQKASNPLSQLSHEVLGETLGRAFLHAGEGAKDIFPIVAGREEFRRAITKQLTAFKETIKDTKPELAAQVDDFLADDALKDTSWKAAREGKVDTNEAPKVVVENGVMTMTTSVPKGKAWEIVESLATTNRESREHLCEELNYFRAQGVPLPEELNNWKGLQGDAVPDKMIALEVGADGKLKATLEIQDLGEEAMKAFADSITARKAQLIESLSHYAGEEAPSLSPEAKAKLKAADVVVETKPDKLELTFTSSELAEHFKAHEKEATSLISHAIATHGDTQHIAMEFVPHYGREDVAKFLAYAFKGDAKKHPRDEAFKERAEKLMADPVLGGKHMQFGSVDSVEFVGFQAKNPEHQPICNACTKHLQGQKMKPQEAGEKVMDALAEVNKAIAANVPEEKKAEAIVTAVDKAHEAAHQGRVDGFKEAQVAQAKQDLSDFQHAFHYAALPNATMIPHSIQRSYGELGRSA